MNPLLQNNVSKVKFNFMNVLFKFDFNYVEFIEGKLFQTMFSK